MSQTSRQMDHPADPIFAARWSRRAFSDDPIPDDVLMSLFEAARWAPSARNAQPWHFLYVRRDGTDWPLFLDLLYDRNRIWASRAAALVAILSRHSVIEDGKVRPWRTHGFDTGAAWAQLALQAARLGWTARAMGGFDLARAPAVLNLPDDLGVQAIVAIGRPGVSEDLPDHLRALEVPNDRRPVTDFVNEGRFGS